jgi:hypothetical protein
MNPWSIWIWPWATTMDMHRRAMESLGEVDETVARDKPEWTTPNRVVVDLAALQNSVRKKHTFPCHAMKSRNRSAGQTSGNLTKMLSFVLTAF